MISKKPLNLVNKSGQLKIANYFKSKNNNIDKRSHKDTLKSSQINDIIENNNDMVIDLESDNNEQSNINIMEDKKIKYDNKNLLQKSDIVYTSEEIEAFFKSSYKFSDDKYDPIPYIINL